MDPTASLTRLERALLRVSTHRGIRPFVVAVSGVSVALSLSIAVLTMLAVGSDREELLMGIAIAAVVPMLVAPAAAMVLGRLLIALDGASSELHHLSRIDPLTGVLNRRAFADDADAVLNRRASETLVVSMIDIDHFKTVNDRHGHGAGDTVLTALARALTSAVGAAGIVGRFGGDEFVALQLTAADEVDEARLRLRAACDLGTVLRGVSASIGEMLTDEHVSLPEALARADHALYQAKRARDAGSGSIIEDRLMAGTDGIVS